MRSRSDLAFGLAAALLWAQPVFAEEIKEAAVAAPAPAVSASAVLQAVKQLRDEEHFGREHPERYLRFKPGKEDKKPAKTESVSPWLLDFFGWLNRIGRVGVWTLGAIGIALIAVLALRAVRRGAGGGARVGDVKAALTSVREYDIRPESLPEDVGAAAWGQWQGGEHRAALVLLYRGALSRLVHRHAVPIRGSSTEGDCMALATRHLADHRSDYFTRVTQARLLAAYADRWPADAEMRELCQLFEMRLAALPASPASPAEPAMGAAA